MNRQWMNGWRVGILSLVLTAFAIQAEPYISWMWEAPATYENGQAIIVGDLENYTLSCGPTSGGPYPASKPFDAQIPPSMEDMAFLVGGVPGQYFCVSTVSSIRYGLTSGYSNEVNFTVEAVDLGYRPAAPRLSMR